jgi:hypothetical protein
MSDLLNQASLVMVPSGYKEDTVYSVVPSDGSGDLSFTRASNGTRVNSAGLVEVCPWNLVQNSENFSAVWTAYQSTITSNTATAPNGTLTADSITDNSGNDVHIAYQTMAGIVAGTYTISLYAKASTLSHINLQWYDGTTFYTSNAFNLSNGTTTGANQSIESVGNGWYRCIFTFTTTVSGTQYAYVLLNNGTSNFYTGTGTGTVFIWGAQVNIGSTAKPYFPTTDRLNVPRLTYQNGGGGCPSLLLEKQSTNVVLNSEDFSGATWLNEDIIVSTNQTISPDGTQNADKLIANTTTLDHSIYQTSSGSTRTFSIYAKAGEYNYIFLGSNNNSASDGAFFNLSNGTISQNTSGLTASIESVGNGWYRCIVSSTSWPTIYTILCLSTNGTSLGFTGNNTSGIYVWGCQVENSSYPTSYIPTTSASATRVADACVKTGISSLIGQTSGTVFWDIQVDIASAATLENIFNLDAGSFSDTIYIAFQGSLSRIVAEMYVTGVAQASFNLTSITAGRYKMAIGYANNNTAFFINGTQVGTTDTTCSVPAMSRLQMGSGVLGPSDGKVNQAVLFTTRLSNSELASLTSL